VIGSDSYNDNDDGWLMTDEFDYNASTLTSYFVLNS